MRITHSGRKNLWFISLVAVGVFLASAVLFQTAVKAAEEAQIQAAIQDLSSATGQNVTSEEQAKDLCNQEQYLDVCADIGKKHNLYTEDEIGQVDAFLNEIKGQVLADIKACQDEGCLIKVASQLAQKVQASNPTLAANLKLTTAIVEQKNSVVQAAKEIGVSFRDCEAMNPDTAPVDLLRNCARLAKDARVQQYIPEEKRVLAAQFEDSSTLKLREALTAGTYQCGDGTLDGCGNFCLNSAGTGGAGIPAVCTQIANEIFGAEGVRELETAYNQVGQVKDYYSKKFILVLPDGSEVAGDRQIRARCDRAFSNRNLEVARACGSFAVKNGFAAQAEVDKGLRLMESFAQKGQNANFDDCLANPAACRDFLPEDEIGRFDAGRQIFEIMRIEIGFDPSQCERGAVDQTIGIKCFEGSKRALAKIEGLGLANQSQEARFIIEDIKRHVAEGENLTRRKDEFRQVFSQQGGPGGCRSETECFVYCSDAANGPECISFGAQQGISGFRGEEAVQRFNEYNQNLQRPGQGEFPPLGHDPRFIQPGPGFSPPPGTGFYPPYPAGPGPAGPSPECFTAIQSGDFARAKTVCASSVPVGPTYRTPPICPLSPYIECPAGQYRESHQNQDGCWVDGPCQPAPTYSPGPTFTPSGDPVLECQRVGGTWDSNVKSCRFPGPTYSPGPSPVYSPPSGQKDQIWNANGLRSLIRADADPARIEQLKTACAKVSGGANIWLPGSGDPSSKDFGMPDPIKCQKASACTAGQYFDGASCTGASYTPYPTPIGPIPTGGTGGMYSCFYPNATKNGAPTGYTVWCEKDYFNCHEGSKTGPSIGLDGLSLGAPSSCESGYQGQSCNNNKFCDSNETYSSCPSDCGGATYSPYPTYSPPPGTGGCPTGYHYHGESGGFCLNDQENYGGTCYNSSGTSKITCPAQPTYSPSPTYSPGPGTSSCSQSLINLLGTGCHWMYSDSSGRGIYCDGPMTKSAKEGDTATIAGCSGGGGTYSPSPTYSPAPGTSYTPAPSCPSGQWWDPAINGCKSTTPYDTAAPYPSPSPYSGYCGDNVCNNGETASSCYSDCGSGTTGGGFCGNGFCESDESSATCPSDCGGGTTYTPPPTCGSNQYWDGQACVTASTPPPSTPDPAAACSSSGGSWDGSTCVFPTPPPPPAEEPPPPTSGIYPYYMAMHCQRLGRTWNGEICEANGLFVRFFENSGMANMLRLFQIIP